MQANSVQVTVQDSGGGQPHPNVPSYQCVNFIIALEKVYPPRP
jgi:microcystin-dependent protein